MEDLPFVRGQATPQVGLNCGLHAVCNARFILLAKEDVVSDIDVTLEEVEEMRSLMIERIEQKIPFAIDLTNDDEDVDEQPLIDFAMKYIHGIIYYDLLYCSNNLA